ncbi:MAG: dihydroneopterin aldolase [bacterium]
MTDRIIVAGMNFWGYHGVRPEENALGQPFIVDVELYLDLQKAGRSDDLEDTVNYGLVYRLVEEIVTGEPRRLLEKVAETIAAGILEEFPVTEVVVRVKKPHVPLPGIVDYAAVEIRRGRTK